MWNLRSFKKTLTLKGTPKSLSLFLSRTSWQERGRTAERGSCVTRFLFRTAQTITHDLTYANTPAECRLTNSVSVGSHGDLKYLGASETYYLSLPFSLSLPTIYLITSKAFPKLQIFLIAFMYFNRRDRVVDTILSRYKYFLQINTYCEMCNIAFVLELIIFELEIWK